MSTEEFCYSSSDGKTKIHAVKWVPEGEIKAVIQISHGMLEHIERYDEFAGYMAEHGILVAGNDHLGHGNSVLSEENRGYFGEGGSKFLIEDMHELMNILKNDYPDSPFFILGHSMGSFFTRQFISLYGNKIDGAIISGTGQPPCLVIKFGIFITKFIASFKSWRHRSRFVNYLSVGSNNKKFKPSRTKFDWLTRDDDKVDEYVSDPKINFIFTLNAFYNMFEVMISMNEKERIEAIPNNLPLIFISGDNDPVGKFGNDVRKVSGLYRQFGKKNISVKIYSGDRHEVLNELDREQVYEDVLMWMDELFAENESTR